MLKNYYFLIPIIGAIPWGAMLTAMLIAWSVQGHPIYWFIHRHQIPVYISHIGATNLQPLFISCSGWQGLLYAITIITEYFLRKSGKLQFWFTKTERNLLFAACITGSIGQIGILLCSIFDTKDHPKAHIRLLGVFVIGVLISMICIITQYTMMAIHYSKIHVSHKLFNKFLISAILKTIWVTCAIVFACIFMWDKTGQYKVSAIFEWILAYSYLALFGVFAYDLYPASKRQHKNYPYIKDWNNRGYYLYDKNFGSDEKSLSLGVSNELGETLVHSPSDSDSRPVNREFTDSELAQYPINDNQDEYPIPDGQSVPVYNRV